MRDESKVQQVLAALETGKSLLASATEAGIPESNFRYWVNNDSELAANYARAREIGYRRHADAIIEIADQAEDPNKARVQIDARKWILSKMLPKLYGDKVTHEVSGTIRHAHELSDDALADIATRGSERAIEAPAEPQEPAVVH